MTCCSLLLLLIKQNVPPSHMLPRLVCFIKMQHHPSINLQAMTLCPGSACFLPGQPTLPVFLFTGAKDSASLHNVVLFMARTRFGTLFCTNTPYLHRYMDGPGSSRVTKLLRLPVKLLPRLAKVPRSTISQRIASMPSCTATSWRRILTSAERNHL